MFNFKNDYNCLCHENILVALTKANAEVNEVYGNDLHTLNAKRIIKNLLKNDKWEGDRNIPFSRK